MKKIILSLAAIACTVLSTAQSISIESFATGLSAPVDIQNAGDDRLFVVEKAGRIIILESDGTESGTFLNITSLVSGGGEQGLLGLAFHPNYTTNGHFFVNYTDTGGDSQISRFTVSGDPDVADAGSEFQIIDYAQPFSNHNGGSLVFGPDGLLYIGTGDGGSGGDPGNRAQNKQLLLGKMLRIDIDNPTNGNNYGIPADNPYLGDAGGLDEIWAIGLRNPFKYDFDPASNDLWIADVGQNAVEEIDRVDYTEADLNYGWRCYEGSSPFNTTGCPAASTLTFPVFEYAQGSGCSITGGKVYTGTTYPDAQGFFFYADLCDSRIAAVGPDNVNQAFGTFGGNTWTTFGRDVTGEIYIGDFNGTIYKITDVVVLPLSTDSFEINGFRLFPNPATNTLTLTSDSQIINEIAIYDLKGSLVIENSNTNTLRQEMNISALTPGLYITEVTSENGNRFTHKLVIK